MLTGLDINRLTRGSAQAGLLGGMTPFRRCWPWQPARRIYTGEYINVFATREYALNKEELFELHVGVQVF